MDLRAGELDQRITIQQPVSTQDVYGQAVNTWSDLCSVWAKVEGGWASEIEDSNEIMNVGKWTVHMRYRSDVTPEMRIKFGDLYLGIIGVENVMSRGTTLKLTCETKYE